MAAQVFSVPLTWISVPDVAMTPRHQVARFMFQISDLSPCFNDVCRKEKHLLRLHDRVVWTEWIEGYVQFKLKFANRPEFVPYRRRVAFVVEKSQEAIPMVSRWSGWSNVPSWATWAIKGIGIVLSIAALL